MKLSIILPCYNESAVITHTYERMVSVCRGISENVNDYELLFVNDGSADNTFELLQEIAANDAKAKVISFSRNFGHQNAVTAGLHKASGDYIVIIDADLQDPPEVIPDMINLMVKERCDVVYAVRKSREGETFFKKFTAKLFYRLLNKMSEVSFPVDTGDFRLINKKVVEGFKQVNEKNKYLRGIISWMGFKQVPFYYERHSRFAGETKYTFSKMVQFATTGIMSFSKVPLKLALRLGLLSIFIAFILIGWVLYQYIINPEVLIQGWASTIIVILFLGGVQLITVGIIGKYIGSIFDEVKSRPDYLVSKFINFEHSNSE